ncbi:bactofilin family protein [Archangium lansingense]|uniref:Polymer-forming cytoskeletal protein n=1 Tax=Archangium lansingense TaxID=2995310 RepID=A0ABT4AD78_9BACT|nr:polymer-forming cytoskeletal protein [Archangium lansinium]MCY1079628.1 polymer-forming cytoskeletal protein [Archangium lansinium]
MATAKELAQGANVNNTVVGQSILISGKLTGDEDLTVRGRVEGELTLSRTLIVEPTGVVKANVAVKNAIVSGVVVGNINATESVELTREGRMVGDIHAPRVIIVDGASFRGRVDMGEVEPGRMPSDRSALPRPSTTVRPAVRPGAAPARPALPGSRPTPPAAPAATRSAATAPTARPTPPPAPGATAAARPAPPAPPAARAAEPTRPEPPRPPASAPVPPTVAEAARKKVVVKKKGR